MLASFNNSLVQILADIIKRIMPYKLQESMLLSKNYAM
jgi:hypothetical protein